MQSFRKYTTILFTLAFVTTIIPGCALVGHTNRTFVSALAPVMQVTRQILAVAILALYVAQLVGGRSVHLWQCSASSSACSHDDHCSNESQYHHPHDDCHPEDASDEQQQDGDSPDNHQHDPSSCWVCNVLGQAQDKPLEAGTTISLAVSPARVVGLPEFYLSLSRSGFHSRAPPAVLGHQS